MPRTQPERDVNREGRKRAEKGQKMAEGTKRVRTFLFIISLLSWLPFLNTYRTMCIAPEPGFREILLQIREFDLAA